MSENFPLDGLPTHKDLMRLAGVPPTPSELIHAAPDPRPKTPNPTFAAQLEALLQLPHEVKQLRNEIAQLKAAQAAKPMPNELIDYKKAAAYLGISPRTLFTYKAQGAIAYHKLGEAIRFTYADLDEFAQRTHIPVPGKPKAPKRTRKPQP